jgi:hypothetical protein
MLMRYYDWQLPMKELDFPERSPRALAVVLEATLPCTVTFLHAQKCKQAHVAGHKINTSNLAGRRSYTIALKTFLRHEGSDIGRIVMR